MIKELSVTSNVFVNKTLAAHYSSSLPTDLYKILALIASNLNPSKKYVNIVKRLKSIR